MDLSQRTEFCQYLLYFLKILFQFDNVLIRPRIRLVFVEIIKIFKFRISNVFLGLFWARI